MDVERGAMTRVGSIPDPDETGAGEFLRMIGLPAPRPPDRAGRPSGYTRELAAEICRRVAVGQTVAEIARDPTMPPHATMYMWTLRYPDFGRALDHARELQGEAWGERAVGEAMNAEGKEGAMVARVRADTLLRAAARRDPARWGERRDSGPSLSVVIHTDLAGPAGAPPGEYRVAIEGTVENDKDINGIL